MRKLSLTLPQLIFVAATRGALGVGIGLLLAGRIPRNRRRVIGSALAIAGALSTIPAALTIFRRQPSPGPLSHTSAA
ncbi:MAG TPA: hypothetical protein VF376_03200 [Thermoanaerobaculia bacterium]